MYSKESVYHKFLANGFKTIYAWDNSYPLVNLQLYVRMGSCWESPQQAGYSHFTEHLVFKSTQKYPKNTLMEKASFLGASINAFTEFDSTCFYLTLPSEHIEQGIELLTELVRYTNFSDEDFRFERKVVLEELKQYRNDPEDFFVEQVPAYYFKSNPYRNPIIGTEKSLKEATPEKLRDFYRRYYRPNNCFLCITGSFDKEKTEKMVHDYYHAWEEDEIIKQIYQTEPFPMNPDYHFIPKKVGRDILGFVVPELSDNNPESYLLSLIGKAFSVGKNSRLYKRLYIKEKLIDAIKVHSLSGIYDGLTIIMINPRKNADLYQIIEIFLDEYKELFRFGLHSEEIENHKRELVYSSKYTLEYVESFGLSLGTEEILGDYRHFFEYENIVNSLTEQQVQNTIKNFFNFNSLYIFSSGKKELDKERLFNLLDQYKTRKIKNHTKDMVLQTTLPNGLEVFLKKIPGKPICGVSMALKSNQLMETPDILGINQLTATNMLYGNKKRDYDQFLNYCTNNGIQFGISTSKENTKLKLKCFNNNLLSALESISDVLFTPIFSEEHFQNLKKSFISNLNRMKDYPQSYAVYQWKEMMFGKSSNLLSKEGLPQTLQTFSRKKIMEWYHSHILNAKAVLTVIGDIDFDDVLYSIEKLFSKGHFYQQHAIYTPDYQPKDRKMVFDLDQDQSILNLGGFSCKNSEKEKKAALYILSQIIGGDINSRLFTEVREKRGLAYSVEFDFDALEHTGYFDIFSIVDKDREEEAIDCIRKVLFEVAHKGVTKEELLLATNYIKGQSRIEEESVQAQAQIISTVLLNGYDYQFYLDREKRLNKVTLKQIKQLAEEYFRDENLFLHILH